MTTAHIEAGPGVDEAHTSAGVVRYPIVFAPLFAPFGMSSGYVTVTLTYLLRDGGTAIIVSAFIASLSLWLQTWKMLWAPVVDTVGSPKLWYGLGTIHGRPHHPADERAAYDGRVGFGI